jgi:CheY-like chemotaxis protein
MVATDQPLGFTLALLGHHIHRLPSRAGAVEAARSLRPQMVIIDVDLAGLDGYHLARRLRQQPGLEGLRLVALSRYADDEKSRRFLLSDFDDHLAKPTSPEAVLRLLEREAVYS